MHIAWLLISSLFAAATGAQGPIYRTNLDLNNSRLTVEYGGAVFDNTTLGIVQSIRNVSTPPLIRTHTWLLDRESKPVPAIIIMMGHHIQSGSRPLHLRWLVSNVTLEGNLSNALTNGGVLTSMGDPMLLDVQSKDGVPYMNPLLRCQQNNTVWCGQNNIITIYPQVEGFNMPAGSTGGNSSRKQEGYDVAQLRLDQGYFDDIAANNRSGFNVTQFQLDVGLARSEDGRLLSETSPIGVIQMSTFGPDGGVDQRSAAFSRRTERPGWSVMLPAAVTMLNMFVRR